MVTAAQTQCEGSTMPALSLHMRRLPMDRKTVARAALPLTLALSAAGGAAAGEITLRGLLEEMVDLERLAELPDPPFTTRQSSSYDRASKSPDQGEAWFANADQG